MSARRRARAPWIVALLGATACLADQPLSSPAGPASTRQQSVTAALGSITTWTLILADSADNVWIAQTDSGTPVPIEPGTWSGTATLWTALDSAPAARGLTLQTTLAAQAVPMGRDGLLARAIEWRLDAADPRFRAEGTGRLVVDHRHGVWRARGHGRGGEPGGRMRFDLIADTPLPRDTVSDPVPRGSVLVRTPAIVSLRIDDCNAADAAAFRILQQLRLTAELGIPSRRIGRKGYCSQQFLEAITAAGSLVESHSRLHGPTPQSFGSFYLEAVGSAQDLRRRGFDPLVFIPPGSWRHGPALLDSPGKLIGPYAALLRRVYVSTESYALPYSVGLPSPGRDGPVAWALRGQTVQSLEARLRWAAADSQWVSFMWHSWDMRRDSLAARLRVIAALRDSGLVTVLPYYAALHATR